MDLSIYLAFSSAELESLLQQKGKTAWMGCHLSAYGDGITPHPKNLTHCDLLVLTDETPPSEHDPAKIAQALTEEAAVLGCEKILLDFQREPTEESRKIIECLLGAANIPVGITAKYAGDFSCPVFLSPPPLWTPLEEALLPWKSREVWLEIAPESGCVTLTEDGSAYEVCPPAGAYPYTDDTLQVSYRTETHPQAIKIHLQRDLTLLGKWLKQAAHLGIYTAIGLYQLLKAFPPNLSLQS